jgi:putative transcriptional regulator
MINYHPDTRLLNEFSSGALPLAQSACVSLHLNYCEQCRRSHQKLQELGSALFEELAPQQLDDSVLQTVLARLDEEPEPLTYVRPEKDEKGYPGLVQRLMNGSYEDLEWQRINSNLRISRLRTGDVHNEFALYHITAGGTIPTHTHKGTELTLVLEGSFSDESGHYREGDFLMRNAEEKHTPTAAQDRDCVCIGVLDAPIRFTDWKYRMINPFLKLQAH